MAHRPLRLVQFTDTHLHAAAETRLCGLPTADSLEKVLALARADGWPPDAILATGDLSQDETPESYRRFVEMFEGVGAPVHCLPGNHDVPRRMTEIFSPSGTVQPTRWAGLGAWQVVLLNTSVPADNGGELAPSELEFLEKTLHDNPDRHALVCLHHNPVPAGSAWLDTMKLRNGDAFFAVTDRFPSVKAIVWGHVHQEQDLVRKGVRLLATPSTCIQFLPGSEKFALDTRPPGYRRFTLYPDGKIETAVRRLAAYDYMPDLSMRGY